MMVHDDTPALTEIELTVPWIPPSVNHYKVPITKRLKGGGRVRSYHLTPEARAFRDMLALQARGRTIAPYGERARELVRYALYVKVCLGAGQRGDGDNFWKVIADSLQRAGVIHSDARVRVWHLEVEDGERKNPRTEIRAMVLPS